MVSKGLQALSCIPIVVTRLCLAKGSAPYTSPSSPHSPDFFNSATRSSMRAWIAAIFSGLPSSPGRSPVSLKDRRHSKAYQIMTHSPCLPHHQMVWLHLLHFTVSVTWTFSSSAFDTLAEIEVDRRRPICLGIL